MINKIESLKIDKISKVKPLKINTLFDSQNKSKELITVEEYFKTSKSKNKIPNGNNIFLSEKGLPQITFEDGKKFLDCDIKLKCTFFFSELDYNFVENIDLLNNSFDGNVEKMKEVFKDILDDKLSNYAQYGKEKLRTYWNNFFWLLESNPAEINFINFVQLVPLYINKNKVLVPKIQRVLVDIGSDVFDCLRLKDNEIYQKKFDETIINKNKTILQFKKELVEKYMDFMGKIINDSQYTHNQDGTNSLLNKTIESFWGENNTPIKPEFTQFADNQEVINAINAELLAEFNFLSTTGFLIDISDTLLSFLPNMNADAILYFSKAITDILKGKRMGEEYYVPSNPNFKPLFSEDLLKALEWNGDLVEIPDWIGELYKAETHEKINVYHIYNALLCGLLNGLNDFIVDTVGQIPFLHDLFRDRILFKQFFRGIKAIFTNFQGFLDGVTQLLKEAYLGSFYKLVYHYMYDRILVLSFLVPGLDVLKILKEMQLGTKILEFLFKLLNSKVIKLAEKVGMFIEKEGGEILLKTANGSIVKRVKKGKELEKILKEIDEIKNFFPEIKINRIFEQNLKKLVKLRKLTRKLKTRNIATARIKIILKNGTKIEKEFVANSGEINRLENGAKNLDNMAHKKEYFHDPFENKERFHDTESKIIISEIEENLFKDLDLTDAKIELEINSLLKPCRVCQREIKRFEKMYNAKTKIHSTEHTRIQYFEQAFPQYK